MILHIYCSFKAANQSLTIFYLHEIKLSHNCHLNIILLIKIEVILLLF